MAADERRNSGTHPDVERLVGVRAGGSERDEFGTRVVSSDLYIDLSPSATLHLTTEIRLSYLPGNHCPYPPAPGRSSKSLPHRSRTVEELG